MSRPRLLDLFCGAGGAAMGYHRAGFDVVGVDKGPMPNYPFEFHQGDAMTWPLEGFAAIHASPPCHDWSGLNVASIDHGTAWMLDGTRERLRSQPLPYVIENVSGSGLPRQDDLFGAYGAELCGAMFGLPLYRHRLFEVSFALTTPDHPRHLIPASKAGHWVPGTIISVAGNCYPIKLAREAMGIDWTNRDELAEAIPPAYTQFIGEQLLDHLAVAA